MPNMMKLRRVTCAVLASAATILGAAPGAVAPAFAQDMIFDEARFGVLGAIDNTYLNDEKGAFITGMLFFDPFDSDSATGWDRLARPRVHVGGDVSTAGEANQIYAGFTWTANLTERFFLEAGFGGTLTDAKKDNDGTRGPFVGCAALFHEYLGAGVNLDKNWRVIAQVEHSSHAGLCGDDNSGLTRAGVLVGYKF